MLRCLGPSRRTVASRLYLEKGGGFRTLSGTACSRLKCLQAILGVHSSPSEHEHNSGPLASRTSTAIDKPAAEGVLYGSSLGPRSPVIGCSSLSASNIPQLP